MLADLERARYPASSLSRQSRRGRDRCEGSGSRRGLQPRRRAPRWGSDCQKSLHTPGSDRVEGRDRGGPLFDGQYASTDTGLIYLRARTYDPATAQFLTVDPAVSLTGAPYNYAEDNPLNRGDATGLSSWNPFSESFWTKGNFISESPLNPIPYYEAEVESYENGCGYFASVTHGLEGAVAGATLVPEDWGSQLFLKFADRFPTLARVLVNQQANQQVTQPGKTFIFKAAFEKLSHFFGG
jgi:RHS repeat-associated protein